jgi:phage terminase large subunit-like protein
MTAKVKLDKLHDGQRDIGKAFLDHPRVVIRCGRRFGKTTLLERTAIKRAIDGKKVGWFGPQYRLNTPTYNRIVRAAWPQITRKSKIDQIIEMRSGGLVEFWTLNDEDAGRSRFYDLVIIDEGSLVQKGLRDTWEQAIAPTLLDRGGSAIMAGTPKGIDSDNFFHEACTDKSLGWLEFHAPTSANPMLNAAAVAKLKDEYPPLVYQQEYLAEFVDWSGVAFFSIDKMLVDGKPVDVTWRVDQVFAVLDTASKADAQHDSTGVVYCARSKYAGHKLVILDWDIVKIEASLLEDWIPSIDARLEELATQLRAREGNVGMWIEDKDSGVMLNQAIPRKGIRSYPIDSKITAIGKEGRAIAASPYYHRGEVKISRHAFDKVKQHNQQTKNHLIDQVCGFRMGQKPTEFKGRRDLLDGFTYSVLIGLGDSEGY